MTTAEAYASRQAALLHRYGTVAASSYLNLPNPALRAHVLSAGEGSPMPPVYIG